MIKLKVMYQVGHTDGYTHVYGGPLYKSLHEAIDAGSREHGNYAVEPRALDCIELENGMAYVVDGPYETYDSVAARKALAEKALAKLTDEEKVALGIKPPTLSIK